MVFQPHLYSRTKLLFNDFSKSFSDADKVIVSDIYAAREKLDKTIHSKDLVASINRSKNKAKYLGSFDEIVNFLNKNLKRGEVVVTIGAGDIYKVGEDLLKKR